MWITQQAKCSICYRSYFSILVQPQAKHHVFSFYVLSINSRKLGITHWVSYNYVPWNKGNINFLLDKMTANSVLHDTVHWLSKGNPCFLHITQFCCACVNVTTVIKNMASICQLSWKSYMFNSIMFRSLYWAPANSDHNCAKCGQKFIYTHKYHMAYTALNSNELMIIQ